MNECVRAQIRVDLHERAAQTEVLHAAVGTQGIRRDLDWDIDSNPITPATFFSVPALFHGMYLIRQTPIRERCENIVLGEVGYPLCHGARFARIVKDNHQAGNTTASIMDWGC